MDTALEAHLLKQADESYRLFWHRLRWAAVAGYVPADRPATLLDVGAGAGATGELLERHRPQARYCFDEPLPSLEAHLERRFGADANRRGVARLEGVDVVTLLDVIEHVPDDRELLAATCARCEPGTTLLVTVPGSMRLWSQWDVDLGHHRRYDPASLRDALADLPLDVLEVSWLFPELYVPALLRAWRNPARRAATSEATAELPVLPGPVNGLAYLVGRPAVALRRRLPFGTSVLAAARVR